MPRIRSFAASIALATQPAWVSAFVPLTPPLQQPQQQQRPFHATSLHLFGRGKKEVDASKARVEFIKVEDAPNGDTVNGDAPVNGDSSKNSEPKDVVASRMTKIGDTDIIDTTIAQPKFERPDYEDETDYDVLIVGAGCAGVGTSLMLTRTFGLDASKVIMVEQGSSVGESFKHWPEEMKFISPSFNQQGWTNSFDLNAVHFDTSPAAMLRSEHPSGEEYAIYLEQIAKQADLNVRLQTKVESIRDVGKEGTPHPGPFNVVLSWESSTEPGKRNQKVVTSRYIVWAAGEFQFPKDKREVKIAKNFSDDSKNDEPAKVKIDASMFPGSELCLHNSKVKSWKQLEGDDFLIVGGYESGCDAAYNLAMAGKKAKVLASTPCWDLQTFDPSTELAPYTAQRLRDVLSVTFDGPKPELYAPLRVIAVDKAADGKGYNLAARWKKPEEGARPRGNGADNKGLPTQKIGDEDEIVTFYTPQQPILCTGFEGSVAAQASHLFAFPDPNEKKGCLGDGPILNTNDESTVVPGVFLVGPAVTHGDLSFCFVYKFRQRFAVVANAICTGLGLDTAAAVDECRRTNMYLDNFATCEELCGDAC